LHTLVSLAIFDDVMDFVCQSNRSGHLMAISVIHLSTRFCLQAQSLQNIWKSCIPDNLLIKHSSS